MLIDFLSEHVFFFKFCIIIFVLCATETAKCPYQLYHSSNPLLLKIISNKITITILGMLSLEVGFYCYLTLTIPERAYSQLQDKKKKKD